MSQVRSYWVRAGLLSFGERFAQLLFGFGGLWMLLRIWSVADFGLWVIFLSVTSIVELARIGLLQNALVKYLSTAGDDGIYRRISSASLVMNVLLGLAVGLLMTGLAWPVSRLMGSQDLLKMLPIYGLTTLFFIPMHQANFTQQANLDFRGIFYGNITNRGTFFLFIAAGFFGWLELSPLRLAWVQVLTTGLGAVLSTRVARPYLRFARLIDWGWVRQLFAYGKYVCGTNLGTMLFKSIDKLMLAALVSPVAAGLYEVAIRITNLAEVPTFSMAAIVFPQSAIRSEGGSGEKQEIGRLYERSVAGILAFLLPGIVLVLLVPGWIIQLVAGDKYLEAVPLLQLTMLYGLFVPFAVQFGTILDSTGYPKINFRYTSLGALLNIFFNFLFISYFGLNGAAYATLLTLSIMFLLMQREMRQRFGVSLWAVMLAIPFFYEKLWEKLLAKLGWRGRWQEKNV